MKPLLNLALGFVILLRCAPAQAIQPPNLTSKVWLIPGFELCPIIERGDGYLPVCDGQKSVLVLMNPGASLAHLEVFYFKKTGELVNYTGTRSQAPGTTHSYVGYFYLDFRGLSDAERTSLLLSYTPAWALVVSDQNVLPTVAFYSDVRGFQEEAYPVDCSGGDPPGYEFVCEFLKEHPLDLGEPVP